MQLYWHVNYTKSMNEKKTYLFDPTLLILYMGLVDTLDTNNIFNIGFIYFYIGVLAKAYWRFLIFYI